MESDEGLILEVVVPVSEGLNDDTLKLRIKSTDKKLIKFIARMPEEEFYEISSNFSELLHELVDLYLEKTK